MIDIQELKKLPKEQPRTIRFYKKGGSYYAIEEDAEVIAQKYLRSIGSLKETQNKTGHYISISETLYVSLLRDLLLYNRTSVELYEFESNEWNKVVEASPGDISQVIDLMNSDLDLSTTSLLLSISCNFRNEEYLFDASCCDPTLFTISTTEFYDNSSLNHFESLITQTMPSEILFYSIPPEILINMKVISEKFEIPYKEVSSVKNVEIDKFPNSKSMKALVNNLHINLNEFVHQTFSLDEFLTLDYSSTNALNIFPENNSYKKNSLPTSLYQLLNECVTPMGSRLLHQYLQQPLLNITEIEKRQRIIEYFNNHQEVSLKISNHMKQLPDISRLIRKFVKNKSTLQDCVRLYDIVLVSKDLKIFEETTNDNEMIENFVNEYKNIEEELNKVQRLIEETIDFDKIPQHIYRIKPNFDETLGNTSQLMEDKQNEMEELRRNVSDEINIEEDKVKLERSNNMKTFYFRISRNLERNIRNHEDFEILETRKDGVRFTSYQLKRIIEEYFEYENEYDNKQKEIIEELICTLKEFSPIFQILNDIFSTIDVFISLSKVSISNNYVCPEFDKTSNLISLEEARHPLIEKHCFNFIPNTIRMERGNSSFLIISGPNSAGKSTLMKTVGICIFLSHIGSFVPCHKAIIPIITSIHARVGAWDSVHMSTFAVEMTEMSSILQNAKPTSLILVDELGRSTSSSDGFGLAWSISKRIARDIGSFTLFATHFHELCNLSNELPNVFNCHMDATNNNGIVMLYQLRPGPFSKSFGIEAAEHAGFPASVIKRAKEKAIELEIADNETGEVPTKIVIDQNEPYVKFLTKVIEMDYEHMAMNDVINTIEKALEIFEEDKENSLVGVNK